LRNNEDDSVTVEFTPRVRLGHPNFTQEKLEPLIDPTWKPGQVCRKGKLLVRVTGILMFDTEHYCVMPKLTRATNWELHPILKFEYCPKGESCRADSNANCDTYQTLVITKEPLQEIRDARAAMMLREQSDVQGDEEI
jgi:hypothetical protein